jgi:hypothetical protein
VYLFNSNLGLPNIYATLLSFFDSKNQKCYALAAVFCTRMQETTLIFMHANSQPTTKAATMAIGIKENNISTLRKYLPFNIDFYAKK